MSFSGVNVFRNTVSTLDTSGANRIPSSIKSGGAFSPDTKESIAIFRTGLDNSWDNAFITQYTALMQNRLNRIKQQLQAAYKALLEVSTVQQISDGATINQANSAVVDADGVLLTGSDEAFKNITQYSDQNQLAIDDGAGGTSSDGVPSYWKEDDTAGKYEMRRLNSGGSAMSIVNDMKVSFRTEEIPPPKTEALGGILDAILGSSKPYSSSQKVSEYSTPLATGGFWSTLNYLYNFSPREMKYQYATAVSTTTEEAGTRNVGGVGSDQDVLFEGRLLDARDGDNATNVASNEDAATGAPLSAQTGGKPTEGKRIQWVSSNPSDGYTVEKSPFGIGGEGANSADDRQINRRIADNDGQFDLSRMTNFNVDVKDTFYDFDPNESIKDRKVIERGVEEGSLPYEDRIVWEYQHDGEHNGVGIADLDYDGDIDADDIHTVKAAFVNHYVVAVQEVELNSSSDSFGTINSIDDYDASDHDGTDVSATRYLRARGIDGSADHVWTDENEDGMITMDDGGDGDYNDSGDVAEMLLLSGSGKISKQFNGKFVSRQHQISSYNGQTIASNDANVRMASQNDEEIVIAEFEGFGRAQAMTQGLGEDTFKTSSDNLEGVKEVAQKIAAEINAVSMVDTDWHYSEHVNTGAGTNNNISFRNISQIEYLDDNGDLAFYDLDDQTVPPVNDFRYSSSIREINGTDGSFHNASVAFRRTFNLSRDEFQDLTAPTQLDDSLYSMGLYNQLPGVTNKTVSLDLNSGAGVTNLDLVVNGQLVGSGAGFHDISRFLVEGENVIAVQGDLVSGQNSDQDFISISNNSTGDAVVDGWVDSKISTDRLDNGDINLRNLSLENLSGWQSKLMKVKTSDYDSIGSVNTATKVKNSNAFARILQEEFLNKANMQDIFNLGLVNTSIGKGITINADVSTPTGGSITAVLDLQYDPLNKKFTLSQNKWEAIGGSQ